jgi:hypothetical protein
MFGRVCESAWPNKIKMHTIFNSCLNLSCPGSCNRHATSSYHTGWGWKTLHNKNFIQKTSSVITTNFAPLQHIKHLITSSRRPLFSPAIKALEMRCYCSHHQLRSTKTMHALIAARQSQCDSNLGHNTARRRYQKKNPEFQGFKSLCGRILCLVPSKRTGSKSRGTLTIPWDTNNSVVKSKD